MPKSFLSCKSLFALLFAVVLFLSSFGASQSAVAFQRRKINPKSRPSVSFPPVASVASALESTLVNRKLENGLEVIIYADHSIPLVTIELACKNGSYTEPPELNGLSHLYEHMFFKANRATKNQEEYLKTIGELGIAYNGSTNTELVNYHFTTLSRNLRTAMNFMRDATLYPAFDEREFTQEKEVVIGEIDRNESNPYYYLNQEMTQRLFPKYTSRKNPLGNRKTVSTATTDMMRLIQSRYYVPNNSALIVAGDVNPDEVFKFASEYFSDWKQTEDPFIKFPIVEHPGLTKSEGASVLQPIQNVIIQIGWHGPSIGKDDASTYAADVFSFILRQPNSRFQRSLTDSGLTTGVDISYLTQRNVGPITLTAQTSPEKAAAAVKAIYAEIARFSDKDYFTDDELETAKGLLESEDLYVREKVSEYIHSLSFWWASTGLEYYRGYLPTLRKVSRTDIQQYVTKYIQGKPHISLALLSEEGQKTARLSEKVLIGE